VKVLREGHDTGDRRGQVAGFRLFTKPAGPFLLSGALGPTSKPAARYTVFLIRVSSRKSAPH